MTVGAVERIQPDLNPRTTRTPASNIHGVSHTSPLLMMSALESGAALYTLIGSPQHNLCHQFTTLCVTNSRRQRILTLF